MLKCTDYIHQKKSVSLDVNIKIEKMEQKFILGILDTNEIILKKKNMKHKGTQNNIT